MTLAPASKPALAGVIARRLHVPTVEVLQSFRSGAWSIVYVDTHQSDAVFLFFSGNPLVTLHIAMWSGAARVDERQDLQAWALKNAPGIPPPLAACFAEYVALGRQL